MRLPLSFLGKAEGISARVATTAVFAGVGERKRAVGEKACFDSNVGLDCAKAQSRFPCPAISFPYWIHAMKVLCPLASVLCCCTASLCHSEEAPNPEGVFSSYKTYLKSKGHVSFRSHFRDRAAEKSDDLTNALSQEWKIDFEGRRLWVTTRRVIEDPKTKSDKAQATQYGESSVNSIATCHISVDADKATVTGFMSYLQTPKDYWETETGLGYLSYPFGYLKDGPRYRFIPDMIEDASKSVSSKNEGRASLVVLTCKTGEYEFNIRLNHAKGWMAEQIEFTRIAPTGEGGRPDYCLYTVENSSDHGGVWLPGLYRCRVSQPAGPHKLPKGARVVDGVIEIVAGDAKVGKDSIETPKSTLIAEVALSDIDLSPLRESDLQLQTAIPDGTRVSMLDAGHLAFMWRGGKIVPVTAEALAALGNSRFFAGPGSRGFWVIINVVLIAVLSSCFLFRHWRRARG